jgi:hypothetical protein
MPVRVAYVLRLRRRAVSVAAAVLLAALLPLVSPFSPLAPAGAAPATGYWMVASDGGIFAFGDAGFLGSTGDIKLNQPITGMAATPTGSGYWLVASDGGIFAFGDAAFAGSTGAIKLNKPIVGMASTSSGKGYWLVASDGGIFAFGDAAFAGSTGAIKLNKPIVGMASTSSGKGYWLVASDGGIFAFGDAAFAGSTGAIKLNQPITGMATTPSGRGYWLTASDGGVFAFGDAGFYGAAPERPARGVRTIVAMVPSRTGRGYWQVSATGELLAFGDAGDHGAPKGLNRELVGMAAVPNRSGSPAGSFGAQEDTTTTTAPPMSAPAPAPAGKPQFFASEHNPTWGTSPSLAEAKKAGKVQALAEVGDKIFVAGEFAGMVPPGGGAEVPRPYLVALDVNTGALIQTWDAQVGGPGAVGDATGRQAVLALQPSADGKRLYVGGRFRSIGGGAATKLAALDVETGRLDPTFTPPAPDGGVKALALHGDTLYVGGDFINMGTDPRPQVAAVNATTGALRTDWVPPENTGGRYYGHTGEELEDGDDGLVYDLGVTDDGSIVYVGGDFLHFGGQGGILALDGAKGAALPWQPALGRPVFGLTIWPGDGKTVIVATGGFGGTAQAFTPGGSTKPLWTGRVDGDATDVAATTERVYLVGHYDHEVPNKDDPCLKHAPVSCPNGTPHRKLAAFDAHTGHLDTGFNAQANTPQGPYVALVGAHHLYVGGDFTQVGLPNAMTDQPGFAQFNAAG